jgi:hypothetical protein
MTTVCRCIPIASIRKVQNNLIFKYCRHQQTGVENIAYTAPRTTPRY